MVICLATAPVLLPDDPDDPDDPPQALTSKPIATPAATRYLRRTFPSLPPMVLIARGGQLEVRPAQWRRTRAPPGAPGPEPVIA
jgi:hypothetical protein